MTTPVAAAVLVPTYSDQYGDLRIVLIVRAPGGPHGSQIAFPGGVREPGDVTLADTALREASEEIGLPPASVEIVEPLPVIDTLTTGFTIAPFLATIERPVEWSLQPSEVAEVLEPRVSDLLAPGIHGSRTVHFDGWPKPREINFYRIGPHELWGASYRIIQPLLPTLAGFACADRPNQDE